VHRKLGSVWNLPRVLVRSTRICGRFACGFLTDMDFADEERDERRCGKSSRETAT